MQKLFKREDKNASPQNLPTSIQGELSALWSGDTMSFEMEGDEGLITFILDHDDD